METILIVEGYPDALYLPTLGIDNITAIGQGNLSSTHISGLKQAGVKNVIISFDNDPPKEGGVLTGKENTKKAAILLEKSGFNVFVVEPELMSPYKDPDEYIKANGISSYRQLLTDSVIYKDDKKIETVTTTTIKIKKPTKSDTYQKVKDKLKEWYSFKFNSITQKTEYSPTGKNTWKEIDDGFSAMCYFKLIENDLYWSKNDLDSLLVNPEFALPYDPLLDYFNNLPKWDEKTDYIKQYTDNIILIDESKREKLRLDFKKWIVGTITGVYPTDWCNHHIFTLIGGQGKGKSHYLNKLIPPELKPYLQIGIDFESKDSRQQMASRFLINIDELEGYSRKDQNNLKTSITTKHFDIRVPYGRYTAKYTKRCSFMGSTNQMNFLPDPTGSRRFLIQYVKEIYYQNPVDIDNIFSQAKHLYFNGFQFYYCGKEVEALISENEEFSSDSMEEQLLLTYYSPGEDLYYTTTDMAIQIGKKVAGIKIDGGFIKKLGSFLGKHKFKRRKKNQRYVWYCKEKPFDYPEI